MLGGQDGVASLVNMSKQYRNWFGIAIHDTEHGLCGQRWIYQVFFKMATHDISDAIVFSPGIGMLAEP